MNRTAERIGAGSGAVCFVAVMVGNGLALAGQSGATGGPQLLADLTAESSLVNDIGLTLELLGWAALMAFIGYLYGVLRRAEGADGWLAALAFGAGMVMVTIKLVSVVPLAAGWYRRDSLTVGTAETLNDLAGGAFIVSGWATGLLVAAASASSLISRVLPRWLSWFGVLGGIGALAAGTAGILDPRGYFPWLFIIALLWVLLASVVLTLRVGRTVRTESPTRAGAEGVAARS